MEREILKEIVGNVSLARVQDLQAELREKEAEIERLQEEIRLITAPEESTGGAWAAIQAKLAASQREVERWKEQSQGYYDDAVAGWGHFRATEQRLEDVNIKDSAKTREINLLVNEVKALQAENAALRASLSEPPPDVQEAVIRKLDLVSRDVLDQAVGLLDELRCDSNRLCDRNLGGDLRRGLSAHGEQSSRLSRIAQGGQMRQPTNLKLTLIQYQPMRTICETEDTGSSSVQLLIQWLPDPPKEAK